MPNLKWETRNWGTIRKAKKIIPTYLFNGFFTIVTAAAQITLYKERLKSYLQPK